jgi:hypothetical protein
MHPHAKILFALTIMGLLYPMTGRPALAAEAAVEGAWLDQNLDCSAVYVATKKGGWKFKQPVDLFAPAFIISGKRLTTPQASCSLTSKSKVNDRTVLQLSCANSVSISPVKVQMSRAPDGTLVRYMDSDDHSGSKYKICK